MLCIDYDAPSTEDTKSIHVAHERYLRVYAKYIEQFIVDDEPLCVSDANRPRNVLRSWFP